MALNEAAKHCIHAGSIAGNSWPVWILLGPLADVIDYVFYFYFYFYILIFKFQILSCEFDGY